MKLDWNEFDALSIYLSNEIKKCGKKYSGVAGMPRGGLPLAVTLSHRLGLPYFDIQSASKDCLIVDDINDSGATMGHMMAQGYDTAVLLTRHSSPLKTTFSGGIVMDDNWVEFPWEKSLEDSIVEYKKHLYGAAYAVH